jgi:hypothetical protein
MYVYRNIEVRSCKHCCSRKAISVTYSDGVFVDLSIEHSMHIRHIVICGPSGSTIFFHLTNFVVLEIKKLLNTKYVF